VGWFYSIGKEFTGSDSSYNQGFTKILSLKYHVDTTDNTGYLHFGLEEDLMFQTVILKDEGTQSSIFKFSAFKDKPCQYDSSSVFFFNRAAHIYLKEL